MKTIGIIGGLGPESTAVFYLNLISKAKERNIPYRPAIHIWNVPIDYRLEENLLKDSKGIKNYLPYLIVAIDNLQRAGADLIVLPCNTMHAYIDELQSYADVPILNILEEVSTSLVQRNITSIGLLATETSINEGLYQKVLVKAGIRVVVPCHRDVKELGRIIIRIVNLHHTNTDKDKIKEIITSFKTLGVNHVLLGCTDLQVLQEFDNNLIFDSLDILANATIREYIKA